MAKVYTEEDAYVDSLDPIIWDQSMAGEPCGDGVLEFVAYRLDGSDVSFGVTVDGETQVVEK